MKHFFDIDTMSRCKAWTLSLIGSVSTYMLLAVLVRAALSLTHVHVSFTVSIIMVVVMMTIGVGLWFLYEMKQAN